MVLGRSRVEDADLPPKPPTHLDLKGRKVEVAAISVNSKRLRDAYNKTCQCPDLARIVVSTEKNKENHKGLKNDNLVTVQEVCSRERLFQAEAIPLKKRNALFAPPVSAIFR